MAALNLHFFENVPQSVWQEIKTLLEKRVVGNWQEPTSAIIALLNKYAFTQPLLCEHCPSADKHIKHLVIPYVHQLGDSVQTNELQGKREQPKDEIILDYEDKAEPQIIKTNDKTKKTKQSKDN